METQLYLGTVGLSTWYSNDAGQSLNRLLSNSGLSSEARVWALAAHPKFPNEIFAGSDSGVHRLDRKTSSWAHIPSPMDSYHVWSIAFSPTDPNLVLAGTGPATMFRSEDRGVTWVHLDVPFAETCPFVIRPRITQILFDPKDTNLIWATVEIDGVWRSRDAGLTWTKTSSGLVSEDGHGIAVVHKGSQRLLYATTNKGLHVSRDDGDTWQFQKLDTPWVYTRGIVPRADHTGVMFLGNGNTVPGSTGRLLRSRDYGETWGDAGLPGELFSTPWCIATNPSNYKLIFASTCLGQYFRSDDGGETWIKLPRQLGETRALMWLPN